MKDTKLWLGGIVLIQSGQITYHLLLKRVGAQGSPTALLIVVYVCAALLVGGIELMSNGTSSFAVPAPGIAVALGAAVVAIELGFILMYRAGGEVSSSPLISLSIGAILLVFVGAAFLHESVTAAKLAGVGMTLAGVFLLSR